MELDLLDAGKIAAEFPAVQHCIYMDVANQGLISRATKTSADAHLVKRLNGDNDEMEMLQLVERLRERFSNFIGAADDEIAITKNASESLNIVANAIDWKAGDNIVLCQKLEHANNILPWLSVKQRYGVDLKIVPPEQGHMPSLKMAKVIDSRTRLVAVSTASMIPGFRADLAPIVSACRSNNVFLLADATQTVGILHTDVQELGVDGLATSTVKGLMGFYGLGFLFCRKIWAERFAPAYVARFSIDLGDAPESAPIPPEYQLRTGARRFDIGHYNFPGVAAAYTSLGQLTGVGTKAIEKRVTRLAAQLSSELIALGLPVCGGKPGQHSGSIVAVGDVVSLDQPAMNDLDVVALHQHLAQNKVIASVRRGILRFSLHLYNSDDDVARVAAHVQSWVKARPRLKANAAAVQ
jgi:cysteine desulfurase/selenocysteine lyase